MYNLWGVCTYADSFSLAPTSGVHAVTTLFMSLAATVFKFSYTSYLSSATLRKLSLLHVSISCAVSFLLYVTLVLLLTLNGKSKCALKTMLHCSC